MKAASEVLTHIGLCTTCLHRSSCTTRMTFKGQIFHCEEFDDTIPLPSHSSNGAAQNKITFQHAPLKGLCMNCDKAHTCTLPKAADGVWFCNEYK